MEDEEEEGGGALDAEFKDSQESAELNATMGDYVPWPCAGPADPEE